MEEDKHAIVRALHEYGTPPPQLDPSSSTPPPPRGVDLGELVEGERYTLSSQ